MIFEQDSFKDGLDLISPDVQVSGSGYVWLVNARTRYGYVEPITQPVEITGAPAGKKQGIIAVGNSVIAFIAGKAYYKLYTTDTWVQVPGLNMDATVSNIYSIAVPASSRDYIRKLNQSGNITDAMLLNYNSRTNGMPTGIVCQDGVTQPHFISFNETTNVFSARKLGTYTNWTQKNPEYVPIGTIMMFLNQKLFIVAADGLSVYQSVTGQPLNFMVNIDTNGNKLATEALGGADTISFAFDYDPISCLRAVNVTDSFIYATKNTTRVITLDYTNTIFGEPLYSQAAVIDTGITNQYALADISGDYAFANYEGLRNFNAVQQLKFEGRNSVFSRGVARLFTGIRQSYVVAISYDNYVLFGVNSVCGNVLAVYDSMVGQWTALDILNIGQIRQAAIIDLPSEVRFYVITDTDKIYQVYKVGAATQQPYIFTRAFSSNGANQYYSGEAAYANTSAPITALKSQKIDLVFRDGTSSGKVYCTEFIDGVEVKTLNKTLEKASTVTNYEYLPTIQPLIEPEGERVTFNFKDTTRGFKIGYLITWDTNAILMKVRLVTTDFNTVTSDKQKQLSYGTKQY